MSRLNLMAADTGGVEVAGCAPLALTANVEASATPDATRHKPVRAVFPLAIGLSPLRSKMRIASEQAGVVGAFTRTLAYRKSAPACAHASGPLVKIGREGYTRDAREPSNTMDGGRRFEQYRNGGTRLVAV
jgi:hypothetical protein